MANFEEFLKDGHLGPIILGMTPNDVMTAVGDPQHTSRQSKPLLLKYGGAQLSFWKRANDRTQQLLEIAIVYQPHFEPLPKILEFTDWDPHGPPTEFEFADFLSKIDYRPVHRVAGPTDTVMVFLSGVTALLTNGMLHTVRLQQKARREAALSTLSDEREPTIPQILAMFEEADLAMRGGTHRAALLMAWAGLEATLRRTAIRAGREGKIGVPSSILLRELFAAGKLTPTEHSAIEQLRQLRTILAHGLAPTAFDVKTISDITDISKRLLAEESSAIL